MQSSQNIRRRLRATTVTALVLSQLAPLTGFADNAIPKPYSNTKRAEARASLEGLLTDTHGALTADETGYAERLLRSYRLAKDPDVSNPVAAIKDGPFVPMALSSFLPTIYSSTFDSQLANIDSIVKTVDLDVIFDAVMQQIVDKIYKPVGKIADIAKTLGDCIPKKVLAGKSDSCKLDLSDKIPDQPSKITEAWIKVSCTGPFAPQPCDVRRIIYDAAKADIIDARAHNPDVRAGVVKGFPENFRKKFLGMLTKKLVDVPSIITKKFKADSPDPLWKSNTPLVQFDDFDHNRTSLHTFTEGVRADLKLADVLSKSANSSERGLSAILFYAAANELLVLTGGQEAKWDGTKYIEAANSPKFDQNKPKVAPILATVPYGGIGLNRDGTFKPWDWANYAPKAADPKSMQLFPAQFALGGVQTRPAIYTAGDTAENLGDVIDLATAMTEFLALTRPGTELSKHFVDSDHTSEIPDADFPGLFPKDGRMLAIGILGGALKNVITQNIGHMQQVDPTDPHVPTLAIEFHDRIAIAGRTTDPAKTVNAAKLLILAADLSKSLTGDPDVPPELIKDLQQLPDALVFGTMSMRASTQNPDGGFANAVGGKETTGRRLQSQVAAMRAMTRVFETQGQGAMKMALRLSWHYLDRFWTGSAVIPTLAEGETGATVKPSDLWELLQLQNDSQGAIRAALATDQEGKVDWAMWDARFTAIRARLLAQLASDKGPQNFVELAP